MKVRVKEAPVGFWLDAAVAISRGLHEDMYAGYWRDEEGRMVYPSCIGCDGVPTWHPSGNHHHVVELIDEMRNSFVYGPKFFELCDGTEQPLMIVRAYLIAKGVVYVDVPDEYHVLEGSTL